MIKYTLYMLNIRLTKEQLTWLRARSDSQGKSQSQIVREIIFAAMGK